jgi:hypothetical protein
MIFGYVVTAEPFRQGQRCSTVLKQKVTVIAKVNFFEKKF